MEILDLEEDTVSEIKTPLRGLSGLSSQLRPAGGGETTTQAEGRGRESGAARPSSALRLRRDPGSRVGAEAVTPGEWGRSRDPGRRLEL